MKSDALNELADSPPDFGENILVDDLAVRLFIGTTYVYRGEYPRRDPLIKKGAKKNGSAGAGIARFGRTRAAGDAGEDDLERDRMSPEERVERGKSRRGLGENRSQPVSPVFGQRGLCG